MAKPEYLKTAAKKWEEKGKKKLLKTVQKDEASLEMLMKYGEMTP